MNFIVQGGDKISIGPYPNVVNVVGSVNRVDSEIRSWKAIKYYLKSAGGMNQMQMKKTFGLTTPMVFQKNTKWSFVVQKLLMVQQL